MLSATVGQMLVNDALPEDMRDYSRVLDSKGVKSLLQQVAKQYPERYREVSFKLNQVGQRAAQDQGGMSFGIRHLRRSKVANEIRQRIQGELRNILADDSLTDQQRTDKIIRVVGRESSPQQKAVLEEAIKDKNPLALQVLSGSRGKPMNLASLLAADMLYSDHRDEVIPIPVLRSYSEGLSPEEYWAGTYGARRGIIATKFATQEAGFLSKQLNQAGHRLVVMGEDGEEDGPDAPVRGMIVDTDDMDNEGSLLARDIGPYKKNTPLTPKILKHLSRLGKSRILVRSPLVGGSPEGGVYARDVGIRENGTLPGRGEQVGLQAAQALSEPISQGQLSAKHSGGVAGQEKAVGGFQYINQLIQTPKRMQGGAAHSTLDGTVQRIEPAPAGGHYVTINDEKHYVGEGFDLKVKKGDEVEAGDMLSDGIPNPALITKYKGVGEGRRYFVNEFRKAMAGSGMQGHRRNIELLARGLINHVKLTEETDDHVPDDIVPYSTLEHTYKPREGHERLTPKKALGQYLERPVLHYTIGTKIRPSMLKDFDEFGVTEIPVHKNPPPFEPHMVRGMYQLQHDPDWMTQMYGSGLKKSLLESVARGATSEERGTSFIPSLATGTDFGEVPNRAVIQPKPGYAAPKMPLPPIEDEEPKPIKAAPSGSMFFGGKFKVAAVKQADSSVPEASKPPAGSAPATPSPKPIAAPAAQTQATSPATNTTQSYQPPSVPNMQDFSRNYNMISSGGGGPTRRLASSRMNMPSVSNAPPAGGLSPNIMPQQQPQPSQYDQVQPIGMGGYSAGGNSGSYSGSYSGSGNPSSVPTGVNSTPQAQNPTATAVPEVNPEAGQGNSLNPLSGSGTARGILGMGMEAVGSRALGLGSNSSGLVNFARSAVAPGAGLGSGGGAVAGSSMLPTLGGLLPAIGGMTLVNAGTEALDAIGLLPEWAGGDGMGNFGWNQSGFNQNIQDSGYLSGVGQTFMNPLKGITNLTQAAGSGLSAIGNKAYDIATWSNEQSRNQANNKLKTQELEANNQKALEAQRQQLLQSSSGNNTLSPQMRQQAAQQAQEVQYKIEDSKAQAAAMEDETAKWQMGNNSWFGGGYKFRDNASKSLEGVNQQIAELGQQSNLTPEQQSRLQSLKRQQSDFGQLVNLYNKEVGYSGTGAFGDYMRNSVKTKKQKMIELGQQIRNATAQNDMAKAQQLKGEWDHLDNTLQTYRSWAGQ
jgi:hypothetical protein